MFTVIVYSGGLDSTVLLFHLKAAGHRLAALTVDYGQRHRREINAAATQCAHLGIEHRVADLSALQPLMSGSALTDPQIDVPDGHYAEPSMKATVVPNRNMLLLATAAAWAITLKADAIGYAAHAGDHTIYPDCRPEFADAMNTALGLADWQPLTLLRPFVDWTKADIVRRGAQLGGDRHCGTCGTCVERREAFARAGINDPTAYAQPTPQTRP